MAHVDVPRKRDSRRECRCSVDVLELRASRPGGVGEEERGARGSFAACARLLSTRFSYFFYTHVGPPCPLRSRHRGSRATWPTHHLSSTPLRSLHVARPNRHMGEGGRENRMVTDGFESRALRDEIRISPQIRRRRPRC
ncbi:hypothetical protein GW17_00002751 [Ensete ventricosum]|nr:hypothetical protein GW17_00002751 [Ensete ventricosum]RZS06240.1 hypothetical protein BHM03_00036865 [Ensete ventricosum]